MMIERVVDAKSTKQCDCLKEVEADLYAVEIGKEPSYLRIGGRAPVGAPAPFALVDPPRPRRACAVDDKRSRMKVVSIQQLCTPSDANRDVELTSQNRRSTARTADTPALHRIWTDPLEHGRLLQHVGYDDEPQHVASDVDVFEMRLLAVWRCDRDILHGDVEAVLGCSYCTYGSGIVSESR